MAEDEMFGQHHQLNGLEFEQTPGDGEGQGSLACCSLWGHKESDTTQRLNKSNAALSESVGSQAVFESSLLSLRYLGRLPVGSQAAALSHSGRRKGNWCDYCKKNLCKAVQWLGCLGLNPNSPIQVGGLGLVINKCKCQFSHL